MKVKDMNEVNETSEPWWAEESEPEISMIDKQVCLDNRFEREAPVSGFIFKWQWVHPEMETTGGPIDVRYRVYPAEWDEDLGWKCALNEGPSNFETLAEAREHLKSMPKPCPAW